MDPTENNFMTDAKNYKKTKFIIFIAAIVLFIVIGRHFPIDMDKLERSLAHLPFLAAGAIFVTLYVVVTFFIWLSKDIFRIAAALLFGPLLSSLLVFIAELINAVVLFNFSRFLGRGFVEESLKSRAKDLDERLARANFLWLFLFRVTPFIPFRFLDLGAGLTKMSCGRYLAAVILGSPLRIYWLQYILAALGRSVFNPEVIINYLVLNKPAFIFSLSYLLLVILVFLKLRRKTNKRCR